MPDSIAADANPYAAPLVPVTPPSDISGLPPGPPPDWNYGDALAIARRILSRHWLPLLAASGFAFGFDLLVDHAVAWLLPDGPSPTALFALKGFRSDPGKVVHVVADALGHGTMVLFLKIFLNAGVQAGLIRFYVAAIRGEPLRLRTALSGFRLTFPFCAALGIGAAATVAGTLCCLLPGFIAFAGLLWAPWFVADQRIGPLSALRASWALLRRYPRRLLPFMAVCFIVQNVLSLMGWPLRLAWSTSNDIAWNTVYVLMAGRMGSAHVAAHQREELPPSHEPPEQVEPPAGQK